MDKLLPIRPVSQLSEDVIGAAVVQGLVHSPGDVLQPVVLQLEVIQVRINPLEGIFQKRPRGYIHVLPRCFSLCLAGSGRVLSRGRVTGRERRMVWRGRRRRPGSLGSFRRATQWGWGRARKRMVALRAGVFGHWLELVGDLLFCQDHHVILVDCGASVARIEVHDERGDVRGFPCN